MPSSRDTSSTPIPAVMPSSSNPTALRSSRGASGRTAAQFGRARVLWATSRRVCAAKIKASATMPFGGSASISPSIEPTSASSQGSGPRPLSINFPDEHLQHRLPLDQGARDQSREVQTRRVRSTCRRGVAKMPRLTASPSRRFGRSHAAARLAPTPAHDCASVLEKCPGRSGSGTLTRHSTSATRSEHDPK